eukprot:gene23207-1417_t
MSDPSYEEPRCDTWFSVTCLAGCLKDSHSTPTFVFDPIHHEWMPNGCDKGDFVILDRDAPHAAFSENIDSDDIARMFLNYPKKQFKKIHQNSGFKTYTKNLPSIIPIASDDSMIVTS